MASRQEEKEARRKERMEAEAAERRSAARKKRLQLLLGGVLAAGIAAAVVIAVLAGGGGGDDKDGRRSPKATEKLPAVELTDEKEAAKAAGCTLDNPADEGRSHEEKEYTAADYKTSPPTSGAHFPQWADDGIYPPDNVPPLGELVHTLEHGRINVQYKPGTETQLVRQLETFLAENQGVHMLLYQNTTGMEPQVAATAWDHSLSCPSPGPKMWDALRAFRDAHLDRGPEKVP